MQNDNTPPIAQSIEENKEALKENFRQQPLEELRMVKMQIEHAIGKYRTKTQKMMMRVTELQMHIANYQVQHEALMEVLDTAEKLASKNDG